MEKHFKYSPSFIRKKRSLTVPLLNDIMEETTCNNGLKEDSHLKYIIHHRSLNGSLDDGIDHPHSRKHAISKKNLDQFSNFIHEKYIRNQLFSENNNIKAVCNRNNRKNEIKKEHKKLERVTSGETIENFRERSYTT